MIDAMVFAWTWLAVAWLALAAVAAVWWAATGRAHNRREPRR